MGISTRTDAGFRRLCGMPQPPRKPLPPSLTSSPFTVAQAHSVGVGEGRLRGTDLSRPFHGIRAVRNKDEQRSHDAPLEKGPAEPSPSDDLIARCTALLVALPQGAFFTHLTAARLWPVPLPRPALSEPVHVGVRRPLFPPRRSGVVGHRLATTRLALTYRAGLPVVDPATLFCQLASVLSLPDLVAAGDALVLQPVFDDWRDERPWVSLGHLSDRVDGFGGRGKVAAAAALRLIRPGAESRPETLVRLAIIEAGLPEPEVNVEIRDAAGRFIGRGDMVYRRWRVVVEYDGDHHRTTTAQFDRDVVRLEGFAAAGWTVVRVVGRSFFGDKDGCIARVRRALLARGWRPR